MTGNGRLDIGSAHDLLKPGGLSSPHQGGAIGGFPPIADYAYLSDCEVGALVAPSGNVEWMCPPKYDAPSVFGAMLDRDAGRFRLSPADVLVPTSRRYLPGTLVLETTWMTRTGWLVVYDFMAIGQWHHEEEREVKQHRAPSDYEAEDCIVRIATCVQGLIDLNLECSPQFDYAPRPGDHRRGVRMDAPHRQLLARVAEPGHLPRSPLAQLPGAQRHGAQGHVVRAYRSGGRRPDNVAAARAGRRAQLGFALRLPPRRGLHALGSLHAGLRLGGG
jgi:hypothetical protein